MDVALALEAWQRRRAQSKKRKRKPPTQGWKITELARLAGISVRTVRHYLARQVLTSPEFFGVQTRYDRVHLLRLLAIPILKAHGLRRLTEVRRKLDELGQQGLMQLLQSHPLPAATRTALGLPLSSASLEAKTPLRAPQPNDPTAQSSDAATAEMWQRLLLLPGLELMLHSDAAPFVREAAEQIRARYSTQ